MAKAVKKSKKSKKKNFRRRLNLLAVRSFQSFCLLLSVAIIMEVIWLRVGHNPILSTAQPSAFLFLSDNTDAENKKICHYTYQPFTPIKPLGVDFLYNNDDEHIKIASAEKIDAEYLAQALYSEDEQADIIYQIVSLIEKEVTTTINPYGSLDALQHLEKIDLADGKSYELYEEELPEVAVHDEFSGTVAHKEGYHVYRRHKDIKNVDIAVSKKPYYFGSEPVIAVVIDDMGINQRRTADIAKLKAPLTSSFLTYGRRLDAQIDKAVSSGHEIIIHVPMEPKRKVNIAPDTLTTEMDEAQIKNSLEKMIKKFKTVRGINNHMGSQFTEDKKRMNYVMQVLHDNNLFFLDSKTSAKSVGRRVAADNRVAYAHRHVFLDNENNIEYVTKQLHLAENIARRNGYVVAIGHPKSATYLALEEWLPTLNNKHIKLVHMSKIVEVLNPVMTASAKDDEVISE